MFSFFKRYTFFVFILVQVSFLWGQEDVSLSVVWQENKAYTFNNETVFAPSIEGQVLSNGKPNFYWTKKMKSGNFNVVLNDFQFYPAPKEDLLFLNRFGFIVKETFDFEAKVTSAGTENYAVANFFPYIKVNGVTQRISSVQFSINSGSSNKIVKDFATNSVLANGSGTWVKIAVTQDGIYKIDKTFLEGCGISTDGLDPNSLNIFGNGDGRLP